MTCTQTHRIRENWLNVYVAAARLDRHLWFQALFLCGGKTPALHMQK